MTSVPHIHSVLQALRSELEDQRFPLHIDGSLAARDEREALLEQLNDYVLPRFEHLDAPLLAVAGGSTGAGKSTLVNSLLQEDVAASSAIRPTTRRPLMVHHPLDAEWFTGPRILPGFARVHTQPGATPTVGTDSSELELRSTAHLPVGLALLDAPDIDSVVAENRATAHQLLAAADLWLFVTTAARYADAVPWLLLDEAARRNIVIAVVLNRVTPADAIEVHADLTARLEAAGLGDVPVFTIPEVTLEAGRIPEAYVSPIRAWLEELAADATARAAVARRTLAGAVTEAAGRAEALAGAAEAQLQYADHLRELISRARTAASTRVMSASSDGTLLRGEVLARWQEFVGTGEWFARLQEGIGRIRDRVGNFVRGRPQPPQEVAAAVEDSLLLLLTAETRQAALDIELSWRSDSASELLSAALQRLPNDDALRAEVSRHVVEWQQDVVDLVRAEGAGRRNVARALSTGVNALGVTLMMAIFATTGGLTGAELATAGGTAAASQALLVAVFGEDAVRRMASTARGLLAQRTDTVLGWYLHPFDEALDGLGLRADSPAALRTAASELRQAESW